MNKVWKNKRTLIPDFCSTCSALVCWLCCGACLLPEERANELWIESEWTEARTDSRTKWEVIALCLSPLRVYLMAESIKTMMDRHNEYILHDCPPGDSCNSSQHHMMQKKFLRGPICFEKYCHGSSIKNHWIKWFHQLVWNFNYISRSAMIFICQRWKP